MKRIINKILLIIYDSSFKLFKYKTKKRFINNNRTNTNLSLLNLTQMDENFHTNFIYKDENWNHIKYIAELMWNDFFKINLLKKSNNNHLTDNVCNNSKCIISNTELICKSNNLINDWIFLLYNKGIDVPFIIEFEAKIMTEFTEFQLAFNYISIGERYRFNLVNNRILKFEVVQNGFFFNDIINKPLTLKLNIFNKFKIVINKNNFVYILNDEIILDISQIKNSINCSNFGVILWDSKKSDIDVVIKNFKLLS